MMLQPILNQRVLPTQFTQQYLPAITADTSAIHKQIQDMYSKTIVLPATHTVEVKNYVETPSGLVEQPSSQQTIIQSQAVPQPSLIQSISPQTQILPAQSLVSRPPLVSSIRQVYSPQPMISQSYYSPLVNPQRTIYNRVAPGSIVLPTANIQLTNSKLLFSRLLPNQSLYTSVPLYNPSTVSPTI